MNTTLHSASPIIGGDQECLLADVSEGRGKTRPWKMHVPSLEEVEHGYRPYFTLTKGITYLPVYREVKGGAL